MNKVTACRCFLSAGSFSD